MRLPNSQAQSFMAAATEQRLLSAIVNDDRHPVKALITEDTSLARQLVKRARLYQSKIFHWLYVGDTALHLAAAGYRLEIVQLLLAAGADPNAAANHRRSTPLHYAADGYVTGPAWDAKAQVKTIECLLEGRANVNVRDKNGATPLHRAVRTRCAAAVRCLLKAGADPYLKNKPGSTALHLAVQNTGHGGTGSAVAQNAQGEIIQELLSFGMSPNVKSASGKTAWDSAQSAWIKELLAKKSPLGGGS